MGRRYAGVLGLLAFFVVVARGLVHQGEADATLLTAIGCLVTFALLGYVVGQFAGWIVLESFRAKMVPLELRTTTRPASR